MDYDETLTLHRASEFAISRGDSQDFLMELFGGIKVAVIAVTSNVVLRLITPGSTAGKIKLLLAIVGVVVIVVGGGLVVGQAPMLFGADVGETDADIVFEDQTGNGTVVDIQSVSLSDGGFVVVTDEHDSVVGVSGYLGDGTHENVTVSTTEDTDQPMYGHLTATVYQDETGDGEFRPDPDDEDGDRPYVVDGYPVAETASVTERGDNETGDSFMVDSLEGPSNGTTTETATFVAVISNPTDGELRQHVEFRVGGELFERSATTLSPGDSQNVTFEIPLEDVGEGTHTYGVYTDQYGYLAEIDVEYDGPPSLSIEERDNESVTVTAGLPDGGFVLIETEDGDEIAISDELDDGFHEGVTIEFDESRTDNLTAIAYAGDPDEPEEATQYERDGEPLEVRVPALEEG